MKCIHCKGEMIEGYIPDQMNLLTIKQEWKPKSEYLASARLNIELVVKTYRCNKCGYLESYANK